MITNSSVVHKVGEELAGLLEYGIFGIKQVK
jgi:hypothetical protein